MLAVISLPFVRYTIRMVTWLSGLPASELEIPGFNVLWLAVFYGLLILTTLLPLEKRQATVKRIFSPQSGLLVLAGLIVFVWNRGLTAPDGRLHLTLLDGEGTVLVQTPSGGSLLIGGGASPSALTYALGEMLPAGDQRLDLVVIGSTAREDLLGLTGAVDRVTIEAVLWGVDPEANQASRTLYALLAEKGIPVHHLESGGSLDAGDGLRIKVLWADERGAALWLAWENFSALIPTGDVGDHWRNPPMPPSVLVLPDGLGVDALPMEQVTLWAPRVILLPLAAADLPLVGEHPLIDRLAGYPLVTTWSHGWVRVSTDGNRLWVHAER